MTVTRVTATAPPVPDSLLPPGGQPRVSRRSVLQRLALGGATVAVAGTGALSYRVYDNGVLSSGDGQPYDAWSHWRDDPSALGAVGAAVLAASPHNTQPWLFRVAPGRVDLLADQTRHTPAADPLRREHHVGLGCALENLVQALDARGLPAIVTLTPDPADENHLASLTLGRATPVSSSLHDAIGDRRSNRGPYQEQSVPETVLAALAGQSAGLDGPQVHWLTSPTDKRALGDMLVAATEAFIADREQSEEAFSWFRNNRDDIERHRDGLTLDGQGLDRITLTLAKLLPASSRSTGDAFLLDQTRDVHTATAAAYGVITVDDATDVRARLAGGRLLQRVHLAATAAGVGLQHMNQVTERADREQVQALPATTAAGLAGLLDLPGRQALVAFRVGYPERTALRSPRRAVTAVLR